MNISTANIGQVRRNLTAWLRRVAAGERVILTEQGQPQAALIGMEDLQLLQQLSPSRAQRLAALEQARALGERIRAARTQEEVESVELLREARKGRTDELLDLY